MGFARGGENREGGGGVRIPSDWGGEFCGCGGNCWDCTCTFSRSFSMVKTCVTDSTSCGISCVCGMGSVVASLTSTQN